MRSPEEALGLPGASLHCWAHSAHTALAAGLPGRSAPQPGGELRGGAAYDAPLRKGPSTCQRLQGSAASQCCPPILYHFAQPSDWKPPRRASQNVISRDF